MQNFLLVNLTCLSLKNKEAFLFLSSVWLSVLSLCKVTLLGSHWSIELQVLLSADQKGNPVKCLFVISQIQLSPLPGFKIHTKMVFKLCRRVAAEVKSYLMCRHGNLGQPQF